MNQELYNKVELLQEYFEEHFGLLPDDEGLSKIEKAIFDCMEELYHKLNK